MYISYCIIYLPALFSSFYAQRVEFFHQELEREKRAELIYLDPEIIYC